MVGNARFNGFGCIFVFSKPLAEFGRHKMITRCNIPDNALNIELSKRFDWEITLSIIRMCRVFIPGEFAGIEIFRNV